MPTKTRSIDTIQLSAKTQDFYDKYGALLIPGSPRSLSRSGLETITYEQHPWPPSNTRKFRDIGGSMVLRRRTIRVRAGSQSGKTGTLGVTTARVVETQPVWPVAVPADGSLPVPIDGNTMLAMGVKGWNKFKPTRPEGGVGQFIGELRDLPKLPVLLALKGGLRDRVREYSRSGAKNSASDFLNVQFGWLPFYSGARDIVKAVLDTDRRLAQLKRDNGRPVRRSGIISKEESISQNFETNNLGGFTVPTHDSQLYDGGERRWTTTKTTTTYYFSGRFRYFIPGLLKPKLDAATEKALMSVLYDASLSPHTLYQLMPWSWLIDWVSSVGPSINNIVNDPAVNLVADYAYVTAHKVVQKDVAVIGKLKQGPTYTTGYTQIQEVRQREKASPYGFGLYMSGFSPKQLAILAALGLTKLQ